MTFVSRTHVAGALQVAEQFARDVQVMLFSEPAGTAAPAGNTVVLLADHAAQRYGGGPGELGTGTLLMLL